MSVVVYTLLSLCIALVICHENGCWPQHNNYGGNQVCTFVRARYIFAPCVSVCDVCDINIYRMVKMKRVVRHFGMLEIGVSDCERALQIV